MTLLIVPYVKSARRRPTLGTISLRPDTCHRLGLIVRTRKQSTELASLDYSSTCTSDLWLDRTAQGYVNTKACSSAGIVLVDIRAK